MLLCAPCSGTVRRGRRIPVGSQNGDPARGTAQGGNAEEDTAPNRGKEDRGKEGGSNASLESPAG